MEMPVTEYVYYPNGIDGANTGDNKWKKTTTPASLLYGFMKKVREDIESVTLLEGMNPIIDQKDVSDAYKKGYNLNKQLTKVPIELEGAIPISKARYDTITSVMIVLFQDNCTSKDNPCKDGVVRYAIYKISECKTTEMDGIITISDNKSIMSLKIRDDNVMITRKPKLFGQTMRIMSYKPYTLDTIFVIGEPKQEVGEEEGGSAEMEEVFDGGEFHFLDFLGIRLKF